MNFFSCVRKGKENSERLYIYASGFMSRKIKIIASIVYLIYLFHNEMQLSLLSGLLSLGLGGWGVDVKKKFKKTKKEKKMSAIIHKYMYDA